MNSTTPANPLWYNATFVFYFEKLFFVLWCFTVPFYLMILVFMINAQRHKVRDVASPFFKLCISTAVVDLVTLLNNYFGAVFPKWGWGREIYTSMGTPFIHIYFYIAWATGVCQATSVSVLATNRLYAIIFPNKYQATWRGKGLWWVIFGQFASGLVLAVPCLFSEVRFEDSTNGGLIPKLTNKTQVFVYFFGGGLLLGGNSLYLICAYCYLFYILRKRNKAHVNNSSAYIGVARAAAKKREFKLFLMSSSIVAIQLTIVSFFSLKVVKLTPVTTEQFYTFYNALSDIYSGANPYLLWIFSDALRNDVISAFKRKKNTNLSAMPLRLASVSAIVR